MSSLSHCVEIDIRDRIGTIDGIDGIDAIDAFRAF